MDIGLLLANLAERNINGIYVSNLADARDKVMELLPDSGTVGIGNSSTLKDMDISNFLRERGFTVLDKTYASTGEEARELKRKALLADWYLSGSNAVSLDGRIVNIDHSGNRVAAMIYGPNKVIIIVGKNKIAPTLDEAVARARHHAAPLNAKRAKMNPPCTTTGNCVDCRHPQRVCNNLVVIEGQADPHRMTVIIVGEDHGF